MPEMVRLVATRPFRYATRALAVGDAFEASRKDARVLTLIGKAKAQEAAPAKAAAPEPDERDLLRAEYEQLAGKRPFMGWSADALREKIAALKASADDDAGDED